MLCHIHQNYGQRWHVFLCLKHFLRSYWYCVYCLHSSLWVLTMLQFLPLHCSRNTATLSVSRCLLWLVLRFYQHTHDLHNFRHNCCVCIASTLYNSSSSESKLMNSFLFFELFKMTSVLYQRICFPIQLTYLVLL